MSGYLEVLGSDGAERVGEWILDSGSECLDLGIDPSLIQMPSRQ